MRKDDARTRILEAAGPIFAEKGFRSATVREICEKAEMNVASVNYYFGDKENLYVETFKYAHPVSAQKTTHPDWPVGTPPEQRLYDFIHTVMRRVVGVKADSWQRRLMMREHLEPTQACHDMLLGFLRREWSILHGILDELLPEDVPTHSRNHVAITVISQCVHYSMGRPMMNLLIPEEEFHRHLGPEELAEHISKVCLAALGHGPPLFSGVSTEELEHSTGEASHE